MTVLRDIRGSVAAKLLWAFALISVALALLISGVEVLRERDQAVVARQREARSTVEANIDTLSLALWSLDDRVLDVTARSLVRAAGIVRVEVIEDSMPKLSLNRATPPPTSDHVWEVALQRPGTAQTIGTLRIGENYDDIRAQMTRRGAILLVTELTKILATSILLFVVVYFTITRPLSALARKLQSSAREGSSGTIGVPRYLHRGRDEIDDVIDAINIANAEQRRSQERQATAGKMEALGQLAGGIAHDFNNLLGAILGFAGLIRQDVPEGSAAKRFAERILDACERGKELILQIRTFTRAEVSKRQVVDLAHFLRQNESLFSASLPKSTRLRILPYAGSLRVMGSETMLGQLVANLCINASEAFGGREGEVKVGVGYAGTGEIGKPASGPGERLIGDIDSSREYVCLTVADEAGGMPEDVLDHIFEPFFTTKGRQRGTGLGLAVVRGVVESHGGACHVKTRLGQGTVFSIYFPLYTGPMERGEKAARPEPARGKERILIVDDEPDIVDMLSLGLTRLGYEAVGVEDPFEALEAFREDPAAWDVVVTDELMPGMRGVELIRQLRTIRPDIRTMLCTGYTDNANEEAIRAGGADDFLLKPVDAATIAPRLRKLVDAAAR